MKKNAAVLLFMAILILPGGISAQGAKSIKLPAPQTDKGRPLMQVLKDRKSGRQFDARDIPLQVLSDMLWAAFGINRPESGGRTAPSAMNMQEIDVYVAKADGLYLYSAKENMLIQILTEDIRALTGKQDFVGKAPVNLIYVADLSKMGNYSDDGRNFLSATDTGFISENVYLYCASEGLVTVVRGLLDREALAKAMQLRPTQKVILAQTVGYPQEAL